MTTTENDFSENEESRPDAEETSNPKFDKPAIDTENSDEDTSSPESDKPAIDNENSDEETSSPESDKPAIDTENSNKDTSSPKSDKPAIDTENSDEETSSPEFDKPAIDTENSDEEISSPKSDKPAIDTENSDEEISSPESDKPAIDTENSDEEISSPEFDKPAIDNENSDEETSSPKSDKPAIDTENSDEEISSPESDKPAIDNENNAKEISENKIQESSYHKETKKKPNTTATISNAETSENYSGGDKVDDEQSISTLINEMEKIINKSNAAEHFKNFGNLKNLAIKKIAKEKLKQKFIEEGNKEENFLWEHTLQSKINTLITIFKEKYDEFQKNFEEIQAKNLEKRKKIIEKLKNLYTNTEPGINLFQAIREIKEEWKNGGQVAKSEFKILNNNYFHHLNQFYQMLDLNKEYLEQEYAHNLETRKHIIERAKELENEPVVQKALNELQYLHKLWKEEAEPVAEEFRESTWEEFKEISNKIHQRKSELSALLDEEQSKNLEKKNQIIESIRALGQPIQEANHNYWQDAIHKVEELRNEFLKLGSVPRKLSNQNWNDFKTTLREFNAKKNEYYKGLKGSQQTNLEGKLKLIQTAKDNMLSEDWDTAVPLFKKLQQDWKKIGHVPRSMANKVWDDFQEACNTFFNNFREKNNTANDNWKDNYKQKFHILEELKTVTDEEGSIERIEALKTAWNNVGKVPREKMNINTEFNKILREKLKLNKINKYNLKEEGLSENQLTDKAHKIKNQIADLEAEVAKLENNLGFFTKPTRENPILKDTFDKIDEKKEQIENLKQSLHNIITGE